MSKDSDGSIWTEQEDELPVGSMDEYTYCVRWDPDQGTFFAWVLELPGPGAVGSSREEAIELLQYEMEDIC